MPEEARLFTMRPSMLLRTLGLTAGLYVLFVLVERVRYSGNVTVLTGSFILGVGIACYLRIAKIPRLEVTRSGIRYIGMGYRLYTPWSDVEGLESWQAGWQIEGLVSGDLALEIAWWAKLLYPLGGVMRRLSRIKTAPITTGIPLEPYFTKDVYSADDELGNELRRYAPQIFNISQDEGEAA